MIMSKLVSKKLRQTSICSCFLSEVMQRFRWECGRYFYEPVRFGFSSVFLQAICQHGYETSILRFVIDCQEQLIVACAKCQAVKVLNLQTQEVTSSIQSDVSMGWHGMYPGGTGRMFVNLLIEGIVELDCRTSGFSDTIKRYQPFMVLSSLCYVPEPYNLVIWGIESRNIIKAVRYGTHSQVWKVTDLLGVKCRPQGMVYSARHDVILVADGNNHRLLVLHPSDGYLITAILFPEEIRDVHVLNDNVLIFEPNKINCYCMETIRAPSVSIGGNEEIGNLI